MVDEIMSVYIIIEKTYFVVIGIELIIAIKQSLLRIFQKFKIELDKLCQLSWHAKKLISVTKIENQQ